MSRACPAAARSRPAWARSGARPRRARSAFDDAAQRAPQRGLRVLPGARAGGVQARGPRARRTRPEERASAGHGGSGSIQAHVLPSSSCRCAAGPRAARGSTMTAFRRRRTPAGGVPPISTGTSRSGELRPGRARASRRRRRRGARPRGDARPRSTPSRLKPRLERDLRAAVARVRPRRQAVQPEALERQRGDHRLRLRVGAAPPPAVPEPGADGRAAVAARRARTGR